MSLCIGLFILRFILVAIATTASLLPPFGLDEVGFFGLRKLPAGLLLAAAPAVADGAAAGCCATSAAASPSAARYLAPFCGEPAAIEPELNRQRRQAPALKHKV